MAPATAPAPLLVVDDDASIREFLALTLRLGGYDVVFAEDGEPVPDIVVTEKPQLVIMDLAMPHVSGLDALRAVRAMGSTVPVIMLTAHGEDEDKLAAFEAGADDYLVKPFSGRELIARVGAVLRRSRLPSSD
jgi:two-component system response regulator MprA